MLASVLPVMYLNVFSDVRLDPLYRTLLGQFIEVLIIIFFITGIRWWDKIGITRGFDLKSLAYMLPFLLLIGLMLTDGIKTAEPLRFGVFFILAAFTGFCEETMFRGVIYNTLRKHGRFFAILFSSFLFGLAHMLNLFTGVDIRVALLDVLGTFGFGLVFAAAYEYTGTLLPLIVVHALIDFSSYITRDYIMTEAPENYSGDSIQTSLILAAILIVWGIGVLTVKKKPAI
jgi:membrane protease YdiL (CAAX protease family)